MQAAAKAAKLDRVIGEEAYLKSISLSHHSSAAELLQQLKSLAKKLGRRPTGEDLKRANRDGECASLNVFYRRFGSFTEALAAAGFGPRDRCKYTREELIEQLRKMAAELGRIPTCADINEWRRKRGTADVRTYKLRFGSVPAARKAARLEEILSEIGTTGLEKRVEEKYYRPALIRQLQELTRRLGRMPTKEDIIRASREGYSSGIKPFHREFGSLAQARKAARLDRLVTKERG